MTGKLARDGLLFADKTGGSNQNASTFLARCFCAGIPTRKALDATIERYGTRAWDTEEAQQCLVAQTLGAGEDMRRRIAEFSFGNARSSRFTRLLLDEIDHCGADVCEELVLRAAELCQAAHGSRDSTRWLILHVADTNEDEDVIVLCIGDSFSSIGLQVWEAGVWLSGCLRNPQGQGPAKDVHGKRVLELASGTGVCAAAFARSAKAAHAWVTDIGEDVIRNLRRNVIGNEVQDVVSVAHLDVADSHHVREVADRWEIDTLFAADVTYDEQLAWYVIQALAHTLRDTRRIAWIVATRRNEEALNALPGMLSKAGLDAQPIDSTARPRRPECYAHCDWDLIEAWRLTNQETS